jgi:hypothetical protein
VATRSNLALARTLADVQQELEAVVRERDGIASLAETNLSFLEAAKRDKELQVTRSVELSMSV